MAIVSIVFPFLLMMTNPSYTLENEPRQSESPRILVYEYHYYRVYDALVPNPRDMTDCELKPHSFKHSNRLLFEYTGEIEMKDTRVFVLYSLGDLITVFSIHEFTNSEDITKETILSDIYGEGKTMRDRAYNAFEGILGSELVNPITSGDIKVPLVYIMIKDHPSTEPVKQIDFKENITEVHNEKGQIILWTEPFPYDQALYIINAYPPTGGTGSFESDSTFLWEYTRAISEAWGKNVDEKYWGFLQEQTKILETNLSAIDQNFWAKISFLPYAAARYSNYKMMYNRDKLIYETEFPFALAAEDKKRHIIFNLHEEGLDENEEFLEILLSHIDYVYEKVERDNDRLKEYRILYQNLISDFDMLYFTLAAAIGILYVFSKKVFGWALEKSGISRNIPQQLLQILGKCVLTFGISLFVYDIYVICIILSQNQYQVITESELSFNSWIFYCLLLVFFVIIIVIEYQLSKKQDKDKVEDSSIYCKIKIDNIKLFLLLWL